MSRNSSVESISNLAAPLQSYTTLCNAYGRERYRGLCTLRQALQIAIKSVFLSLDFETANVTPSASAPLSETRT